LSRDDQEIFMKTRLVDSQNIQDDIIRKTISQHQ